MNTPMHRFRYTSLTEKEIQEKMARVDAGPECVSNFSDLLEGKTYRIVTDGGPSLTYSFGSGNRLAFSENGGRTLKAGYGCLALDRMLFFSHMVPKSLRGYNVFVDLETNLVTLFEVWFCGGKESDGQRLENREVQRQIHFGYVEADGKATPDERHTTTNRMEGMGMYWKQDTGIETVELYPSVVSSNFVELTRHADNLCFCSPSDYVLVSDNLFIYGRTECEFSGIMTLYLLDLFTETQVGMRLGFNEKDELEYYMFRGTGRSVGCLTRMEPFDEHGENINLGMGPQPAGDAKGFRIVYRPLRSFEAMSEEEMHRAAEAHTVAFAWDSDMPKEGAGMMSTNAPPLSALLVGREFTLRYDGDHAPEWEYRVLDRKSLEWRSRGEAGWKRETYRAFEVDKNLVFFSHMHSGTRPRASVQIALDLDNGLTTCILSTAGTDYYGNEVSYEALFGVSEMEGVDAPVYMRHDFTDELVGKGFSRSWSDTMTSMHLYTTPHSAAWTIYTEDQTLGMQWSAPCIYIKLRDGVYIFNLVEEACNGTETCIVINEKTMYVSGFGYDATTQGIDLNVFGAIARPIGAYDLKRFFGPGKHGL